MEPRNTAFLAEVNRVLEERAMTQRKLASIAGVNPSYVSNWMLGQVPSPEVVLRLARALGEAPAEWLRAAGYAELADLAAPPGEYAEVALLGTCLAGAGEASLEEEAAAVPQEFVRGADFFVRVQGDSMEPDYPNGAIVAVKRTSRLPNRRAAVVQLDGVPMVKLWVDTERGPILRSLNPKYPDIPVGEHMVLGVPIRILYVRDL